MQEKETKKAKKNIFWIICILVALVIGGIFGACISGKTDKDAAASEPAGIALYIDDVPISEYTIVSTVPPLPGKRQGPFKAIFTG